MKVVALLVALAACSDTPPVVEPVIDLPTNPTASPFPLDTITVSVAHAGAATDVVSRSFTKGQTIELPGVPFADDLVMHVSGRVGSSDVAYGRTCVFALAKNTAAPTPHLFFSRSVKFGAIDGVLPGIRVGGAAVTYHDGSGLLIGGIDPGVQSAVSNVERFDPQTGQLRLLTSVTPRTGAVASLLGLAQDAQIVLIGGLDASGAAAGFVELIEAENPADRRVEKIDDTQMARIGLTATPLTDGRVIAIGGRPGIGMPPVAAGSVDEVTLVNGSAEVRALRAELAIPRADHTATRLGDDVGAPVLVVGGVGTPGNAMGPEVPIAEAELYKPLAESFSTALTAKLAFPRSHHQAVRMPDNSVLILGGIGPDGMTGVPQVERFAFDEGQFTSPAMLPDNAGLIDFAATPLPDGRVLITGGRRTVGGPPVNTAFIASLDLLHGNVDIVATDNLTVARAGHQATLLCDGTVLISGGTTIQQPAERYNPPAAGRR